MGGGGAEEAGRGYAPHGVAAPEGVVTAAETQTFRGVGPDGAVTPVVVQRTPQGWGEQSFAVYDCHHETARDAALGYAAGVGLDLAELRGPGELTTAEQLDGWRALALTVWRSLGETGDLPTHGAQIAHRTRGVRAERDAALVDLEVTTARAENSEAIVARLRSMIDGRDVPPTDAEIEALFDAGGTFLAARGEEYAPLPLRARWDAWDAVRNQSFPWVVKITRWWSLDASGRVCDWPVVGGTP